MPSKANNNGAAPLAQPPVRTLAVPDDLRLRIEEAHKVVEAEHPGAFTLQQLFNVLLLTGLENVEYDSRAYGNAPAGTALCNLAQLDRSRRTQKDAVAFLRWYIGMPDRPMSTDLVKIISRFAPHLTGPNASSLTDSDDLEGVMAKLIGNADPVVIERVYDDSVQEPLTASEQGRD